MLEWLKDIVYEKRKPAPKKAQAVPDSHIKVDSRVYPLVSLTNKGFTAGEFDTSMAVGQNASITVVVNDRWGKFSFNARCTITAGEPNGRFGGAFAILPPEVDQVIAKYARNKGK